ncbi:hypothetical protein SPRG_20003 [Saprolegnia parasitica CBS 223.65]|uniref:Uncharacterized protein n=1 Tax=Saprolegnia parasitica (strain CBS 223.65) TaxID=695850 RepID=A0A067CQK0_SAPPC|nr:hypothetical protein SPRG_20003 [Saprolegnia parasitica CBS 223.65]KDO28796.1 hypothetical protein SPRG_20003 [Saprolegnia parasitica CBS 223.65]|eukprot:XP_012200533.1 hypothetical protein SPRG_20003 [Saprolegnia parasitica CBS 223.65]
MARNTEVEARVVAVVHAQLAAGHRERALGAVFEPEGPVDRPREHVAVAEGGRAQRRRRRHDANDAVGQARKRQVGRVRRVDDEHLVTAVGVDELVVERCRCDRRRRWRVRTRDGLGRRGWCFFRSGFERKLLARCERAALGLDLGEETREDRLRLANVVRRQVERRVGGGVAHRLDAGHEAVELGAEIRRRLLALQRVEADPRRSFHLGELLPEAVDGRRARVFLRERGLALRRLALLGAGVLDDADLLFQRQAIGHDEERRKGLRDVDALGPDRDAMQRRRLKVLGTVLGPVVLAKGEVQAHADPVASRDPFHGANVRDLAPTLPRDLAALPHGHRHCGCR